MEIVGLADLTVLVLVPESGDEVQTLKSGVMEIADVFVVNKADRPGADSFMKNLIALVQSRHSEREVPVLSTVASTGEGVAALGDKLLELFPKRKNEKQSFLLAEKAWHLLLGKRMKGISKSDLQQKLAAESGKAGFNLYRWVESQS